MFDKIFKGQPHTKSYADDLSERLNAHILRKERMVTQAQEFYTKLQKQDYPINVLLAQQERIDEAQETLDRFLRHRENLDKDLAVMFPS